MARVDVNRRDRAATLQDVSRAAGVSIETASIVLNRPWCRTHIAAVTRERILAIAGDLHYRPNRAGRALVSGQSQALGVLVATGGEELDGRSFELLCGIVAGGSTRGRETTVISLRGWRCARERLRTMGPGQVDGLILVAPTVACDRGDLPRHLPMVSILSEAGLSGVRDIRSEGEMGACVLVQRLLAGGQAMRALGARAVEVLMGEIGS